jgi:hypothetical protein
MESLFSFPVGRLHPLQHAGLSRRTPSGRRSASYRQWEEKAGNPSRMPAAAEGQTLAYGEISQTTPSP